MNADEENEAADEAELLEWVAYAEEDFITAKEGLERSTPLLLTACFHSQQCAEKYLKALLVFKDVYFPKTHDLLTLDMICGEAGIFTGIPKERFAELSKHAVRTRYPGRQPIPEAAQEAFEIAAEVRKFARTFLGLEK